MATHTPAQAIQELVNHTAVLTERLVGLQTEVRKGMNMTPEWGNALTQVVGDTKRMLMAMEHLARLPAFHLDRDGLNAAVAAGVQQGLAGDSGTSLISIIENNSRQLDEAKSELSEAKKRMDQMMEEIQGAKVMNPESRQKFFMQFAPIVGMWSVGLLLAGLMVGRSCTSHEASVPPAPPAVVQQQSSNLTVGTEIVLSSPADIYNAPDKQNPAAFKAPTGAKLRVAEVRPNGWVKVTFPVGGGQTGNGWVEAGK